MARVKRGNVARNRRNKILRLARGFRGSNGSLFRTATVTKLLLQALQFSSSSQQFAIVVNDSAVNQQVLRNTLGIPILRLNRYAI